MVSGLTQSILRPTSQFNSNFITDYYRFTEKRQDERRGEKEATSSHCEPLHIAFPCNSREEQEYRDVLKVLNKKHFIFKGTY